VKLSRNMRMNLNLVPDEGEEACFFYQSQADPLKARGLIEYEMRPVQVTVLKPVVRLTDLGRRVKYQNTDQ